eukprot:751868-Pelagomonas_calceolata.AAC.3
MRCSEPTHLSGATSPGSTMEKCVVMGADGAAADLPDSRTTAAAPASSGRSTDAGGVGETDED